jgi:hypothetical protein
MYYLSNQKRVLGVISFFLKFFKIKKLVVLKQGFFNFI